MVFKSPIHKALFGFHIKSHFLIFVILTLHFNFISFHLHFCTYTSHLGPLGHNLTFLPNLISFCKIFQVAYLFRSKHLNSEKISFNLFYTLNI